VIAPWREFVVNGCLLSYGPNRLFESTRIAGYVGKVLKGSKPADLPIEQPTKFAVHPPASRSCDRVAPCSTNAANSCEQHSASPGSPHVGGQSRSVIDAAYPGAVVEQSRCLHTLAPVNAPRAGPFTILIVDDEETVRDLVVELLQMEGHRVLTASSGMDGLAMVRAIRPDLILVDFQCPE